MPFILPTRLHTKLPVSRFKDVESPDVVASADLLLQKRKKPFRSPKSSLYRIVTRGKADGFRTKIAHGSDLGALLAGEWKYITEELPPLVPHHLSGTPRVLWIIAHFMQKALNEGAGEGRPLPVLDDDEEDDQFVDPTGALDSDEEQDAAHAPGHTLRRRRPPNRSSTVGSAIGLAALAQAPSPVLASPVGRGAPSPLTDDGRPVRVTPTGPAVPASPSTPAVPGSAARSVPSSGDEAPAVQPPLSVRSSSSADIPGWPLLAGATAGAPPSPLPPAASAAPAVATAPAPATTAQTAGIHTLTAPDNSTLVRASAPDAVKPGHRSTYSRAAGELLDLLPRSAPGADLGPSPGTASDVEAPADPDAAQKASEKRPDAEAKAARDAARVDGPVELSPRASGAFRAPPSAPAAAAVLPRPIPMLATSPRSSPGAPVFFAPSAGTLWPAQLVGRVGAAGPALRRPPASGSPAELLYYRAVDRHGWKVHLALLALVNVVMAAHWHHPGLLIFWVNLFGAGAVFVSHWVRVEAARAARDELLCGEAGCEPRCGASSSSGVAQRNRSRAALTPAPASAAPGAGAAAAAPRHNGHPPKPGAANSLDPSSSTGVLANQAALKAEIGASAPVVLGAPDPAGGERTPDQGAPPLPRKRMARRGPQRLPRGPLTLGGSLPRAAAQGPSVPGTWRESDGRTYDVRVGPDYSRNKKKAASLESLCELVGVDVFTCASKLAHVSRVVRLPRTPTARRLAMGMPEYIVVNCMVPGYEPPNPLWGRARSDGEGFALIFYFRLRPETARELLRPEAEMRPAVRLLRRFVLAASSGDAASPLRRRFKGIARLTNLDDRELALNSIARKMVTSYNGTPFIINTSATFYLRRNYFEIGVDVHRFSYLALLGFYNVKERASQAEWDFGFVVQGEPDDELPEQMLGAGHFVKLNLSSFAQCPTPVPPLDAPENDDDGGGEEDEDEDGDDGEFEHEGEGDEERKDDEASDSEYMDPAS